MIDATEKRLFIWADSMKGRPFVWGETDCIMLAAQAADIIGGSDLASQFAGRYTDETTARALLADAVPSHLLAAADWENRTGSIPCRGDILLSQTDEWPECAHVVLGRYALSSSPGHGVGFCRISQLPITSLWRHS